MSTEQDKKPARAFFLQTVFALLGVGLGLTLLFFGGVRLVSFLNHRFPKAHGSYKAQLLSNRIERTKLGDLYYHATFELTLPKTQLKVYLRLVEDKSLYRYLHQQKWGKVYRVRLAKQRLSRRWTLTRVDNVTVGKQRKTKEGVMYLGLLLMGGALIFAAIKSYLQQRLRHQFHHITLQR